MNLNSSPSLSLSPTFITLNASHIKKISPPLADMSPLLLTHNTS